MLPLWLKNSISEGLQAIVVLRLRGTPAEDMIAKTAQVWFAAVETWPVAWDEKLDRPRVSAAFRTLAANCDHWPAPKNLHDALPSRPELKRLNAPTSTKMPPEIREKINAFLAKGKAA